MWNSMTARWLNMNIFWQTTIILKIVFLSITQQPTVRFQWNFAQGSRTAWRYRHVTICKFRKFKIVNRIIAKQEQTRCWHVTISCQPDGRPPQPIRPWKSGRVHLAEGSNVVVLKLPYSTEFWVVVLPSSEWNKTKCPRLFTHVISF